MGKLHAPVEFVEVVKREPWKFVKTLGSQYKEFFWQRGYGMFSVSPADRGDAEYHVRHQEDHHRMKSYQDEFRAFLNRYGIACEEQYVWDRGSWIWRSAKRTVS
jgi:hypothetical protein